MPGLPVVGKAHEAREPARRSPGSSTDRRSIATRSPPGPTSTAIASPTSRARARGAARRLSPRLRRAVALLGRRGRQPARGAGRVGRGHRAADAGRRARPRRSQGGRDLAASIAPFAVELDAARRRRTDRRRSPIAPRAGAAGRRAAAVARASSRRWCAARARRGSARRWVSRAL